MLTRERSTRRRKPLRRASCLRPGLGRVGDARRGSPLSAPRSSPQPYPPPPGPPASAPSPPPRAPASAGAPCVRTFRSRSIPHHPPARGACQPPGLRPHLTRRGLGLSRLALPRWGRRSQGRVWMGAGNFTYFARGLPAREGVAVVEPGVPRVPVQRGGRGPGPDGNLVPGRGVFGMCQIAHQRY